MKLLFSNDWLRKKIASDPDIETEAGPPLFYIRQRGDDDCGIAAIAMACVTDYEAVRKEIGRDAINETDLQAWCCDHGFAWQTIYQMRRNAEGRYVKRDWPPAPFAPSHICLVEATRGYHFTVMDRAGIVFDPWNEERRYLAHPDYRRVNWVMGLFRLNDE